MLINYLFNIFFTNTLSNYKYKLSIALKIFKNLV